MNKTELQIIAAFDAAMQVFANTWEDQSTSRDQVLAAFGGAAFFYSFFKQLDITAPASVAQAEKLLNEAAEQLKFPATY